MNNNDAKFDQNEKKIDATQEMLFRLRASFAKDEPSHSTHDILDSSVEAAIEASVGPSVEPSVKPSTDPSAEHGTYTRPEVIYALSQLQSDHDLSIARNQGLASDVIIKNKILEKVGRRKGDMPDKKINKSDSNTITVVSMLFDYITDDPGLPESIKLLLTQLQVPLLKVAILDKKFFSQKGHPARQLLNELAYACSGMEHTHNGKDSIHQMVRYVVSRITSDFDKDISVFSNLLKVFVQFMERERRTNKIAENMLEKARDHVANEIQDRTTKNNLPHLVETILVDAWKDVLIHIYLRDGTNSVSWKTALQVADDLIWSVQPKMVVSERQRLITKIPAILNGLRDGLTLIQFDLKVTSKMFSDLEEVHLACLQGGTPEVIPHSKPGSQQTTGLDSSEAINLTEDDFGMDLSAFPEDPSDDEIQNSIENYKNELTPSRLTEKETEDLHFSQHADTVKDMAIGTWVEFINPKTGAHFRGKLAWRCDFTEEFTFVDSNYKIVADLTFRKLLERFETDRAAVVEYTPLFDRALNAVKVEISQIAGRRS